MGFIAAYTLGFGQSKFGEEEGYLLCFERERERGLHGLAKGERRGGGGGGGGWCQARITGP